MAVTAQDVAKEVGVSVSTVSRALSQSPLVALPTRTLIEVAAERLGYRPNLAARGLITGHTGNLALVLSTIENPFFLPVIKSVQAQARAHDYDVLIADTDEDPAIETELARRFSSQSDGLILCSPRSDDASLLEIAAATPTVLVNRAVPGIASVVVDDFDAVAQAVRHLWALGHRRIAYAGGPVNAYSDAARRAALTEAATVCEGVGIIDLGHFAPRFSGGLAAADLALASDATAIVAYNDTVAIGVLERLRERGVVVPSSMSVVGFDGIELGGMMAPGLTTIKVPIPTIGKAAISLVLNAIRHAGRVGVLSPVGVELLIRGSTGAPSQS